MKKSLLFVVTTIFALTFALSACGKTPAATATTAPATQAPAATVTTAPAAKELTVVYVTPSTESDYWAKYVGIGIENALKDAETKYGVKINYSMQGPAAESSGDEYLTIFEGVIAKKPDIILMGQLQPEAVAPFVADATAAGIRVNLISVGLTLPMDQYGTLFYCDQVDIGARGAQAFYDALVAKKLPMDGVVGVHMSVVVSVLEPRMTNFRDTLQKLAPKLTILETQYNQNDVNNGISLMEAQLAANGDKIIGFYGGNNVTGDAIVKVIQESGRTNLVGVAVDSDPAEITGMAAGYLDALIVQTPYDQAYNAASDAIAFVLDGVDQYAAADSVNMAGKVVTPANMNTEEIKALLDPTILKK
jgi:ribose transport system substrate-binding protein